MKAYQRYAKLIIAQHLAKIQFIAEHTNCEAGDINTAMTELLKVHSELLDVYMKLWMQSSPDYREAGITDEQFAEWFEKSLIGLKTADGELVIERTEPLQKNVESVLANIKKFDAPVELPKLKQFRPYSVDCINCRRNGFFTRCPKHAYADNKAIGCKNFRAR